MVETLIVEASVNVYFVSKDDAIKYMEDLLGSDAVAEYKERNIFPVAYNVTLTDLSVNYEVQNEIKTVEVYAEATDSKAQVTGTVDIELN